MSKMAVEEFMLKYRDSRPVSPFVAYYEGKLEGLDGYDLDPIVSESPIGNYSVNELIALSLSQVAKSNKEYSSAFFCFSSHMVEIVDRLTPELKKPVVIKIISPGKDIQTLTRYPKHICTEKSDLTFHSGGMWGGELVRAAEKEANILAAISRYESFLTQYGQSWEELARSDLHSLAKIAGDLQFVKAMDFLKDGVEPYMSGFDVRKSDFSTDHHLSETPIVVYDWFNTARRMFQIAEDNDGIRKVNETLDGYKARLNIILEDIKGEYGFIPY